MPCRRTLLRTGLAWAPMASLRTLLAREGIEAGPIGLCAFSCHQHWKAAGAGHGAAKFSDAPGFFRYARELGAEGVQAALRDADPAALRELAESADGYYEADLRLPKDEGGLGAFEAEVRRAREAGASVARAVLMGGRRYEVFRNLEGFRAFHEEARRTLARIEPVARRHRLRIAVENHKDLTAAELAALMEALSSEWVGVLYDTGNNLALLEDPAETLAALAPYALGVHLKDMALQPAEDGFLLSEVPLGTGIIDLPGTVDALRRARPGIVLNLEMATRDPLRVPCLGDSYFATFPDRRESHLAAALARVAAHPPRGPVPAVAGKPTEQILAEEEAHNRHGLAWMREVLGGARP
jgi:sugar phosphate isomerase/epimerase